MSTPLSFTRALFLAGTVVFAVAAASGVIERRLKRNFEEILRVDGALDEQREEARDSALRIVIDERLSGLEARVDLLREVIRDIHPEIHPILPPKEKL